MKFSLPCLRGFCLVLGFLALADPAFAEVRQWSDAKGKAQISAQFVSFDDDHVFLKPQTGPVIRVNEAGLSTPDRHYLAKVREGKRNETYAVEARANAAYAIERNFARKVRGRYGLEITYPSLEPKEWIWFSAKPPETDGQSLQSNLFPNSVTYKERAPTDRELWRARCQPDPSNPKRGSIKFVVGGELFSRHLVKSSSTSLSLPVLSLSYGEKKQFLAETELFELRDPGFVNWMREGKLIRDRKEEGQIDFARRVFLKIADDFSYIYERDMDRRVSRVCEARKSDCGGLSTLFVSAMRANGIPARTLAGRWAKSAVPGEFLGSVPYSQYHVKAEFYADGVGWVPVDMAAAVDRESAEAQLRYFGQDKGDFITMHLDYELVVDTIHFGEKTIRCLQGASYWVTGSGTLDGRKRTETWVVEEL